MSSCGRGLEQAHCSHASLEPEATGGPPERKSLVDTKTTTHALFRTHLQVQEGGWRGADMEEVQNGIQVIQAMHLKTELKPHDT